MKLYRTARGAVLEANRAFFPLFDHWDTLMAHEDVSRYLRTIASRGRGGARLDEDLLAPIGSQEVWAAGVTYTRSRAARMDESQEAGGATFYDRVYEAERPELFFKSAAWRVRGPEQRVRIRRDARWTVPEPELALIIDPRGSIIGYTIANDMSSRDIEGENPLYLPQAKIYDGSCALGPAMLIPDAPLPAETKIDLCVRRAGAIAFEGNTTLGQMRRRPEELVEFLYRETSFPAGCVLLTGTGIVPPNDFTLHAGDEVRITVPPIGTLINSVE
jgi:2-dehydro-3-deoxy-D-arabinonate dehydratase